MVQETCYTCKKESIEVLRVVKDVESGKKKKWKAEKEVVGTVERRFGNSWCM